MYQKVQKIKEEKMEEENNVVETNTTSNAPARKGFNVTSLILGIISVVCCWSFYVAVPTGIIAIIFSVAGKKDEGKGMGTAGMVLGIIGLTLSLLVIIAAIGMFAAVVSTMQ